MNRRRTILFRQLLTWPYVIVASVSAVGVIVLAYVLFEQTSVLLVRVLIWAAAVSLEVVNLAAVVAMIQWKEDDRQICTTRDRIVEAIPPDAACQDLQWV